MTSPPTPSRRSLLAAVTGATAGLAGCGGILGGSESYDCMAVTLAGGSFEYRLTLEYGVKDGPDRRRRITGSATADTTLYTPDDCEHEPIEGEERISVTPPITATAELAGSSHVGPEDPVTFELELDDEVVDSAEITAVAERVTLEHRP